MKLLVTRYLPGGLVLGSEHAAAAATYRQAGELLATGSTVRWRPAR